MSTMMAYSKTGSPCFEIDQLNAKTPCFLPAAIKVGVLDIRLEWEVGSFGYQEELSLNTDSVSSCVI